MWNKYGTWVIHGGLFVLTFLTTTLAHGAMYAVAIMTILFAHEMGHFFTCRKYGIPTSLPKFIPMPNLLGTMGAMISMKGPIPNRKALFDIGVSGPLTGLILAIPTLIVGIYLSEIQPKPVDGLFISFGEPLLFHWISLWLKGPIAPNQDLFLHPVAFAGWAALFVTSINLFPTGQLDGGHMIHALVGNKLGRWVSYATVVALVYLGIEYHPTWYFFAGLILFFALRPAPILHPDEKLPLSRWGLAILTYALMILCFTPVPFDTKL